MFYAPLNFAYNQFQMMNLRFCSDNHRNNDWHPLSDLGEKVTPFPQSSVGPRR